MLPFICFILSTNISSGNFPFKSEFKIERTKELNSCPPGIPEKVILDFFIELKILNLG